MRIPASGLLVLSCLLAGCTDLDPYERPGVWHPLGANAANARAMVADPNDLEMGQGSALSSGDMAAAAVARLRADQVKHLPASAIADVGAVDNESAQSPGNAASAAAPVAAQATTGASQ